jgi:hypothetical protein
MSEVPFTILLQRMLGYPQAKLRRRIAACHECSR